MQFSSQKLSGALQTQLTVFFSLIMKFESVSLPTVLTWNQIINFLSSKRWKISSKGVIWSHALLLLPASNKQKMKNKRWCYRHNHMHDICQENCTAAHNSNKSSHSECKMTKVEFDSCLCISILTISWLIDQDKFTSRCIHSHCHPNVWKHSSLKWLLLSFVENRVLIKIFPSLYLGILMQVLKHAWACTCISHQKVCLCSATVWGYIKHTYAQIFTDCISLSFLRCLQPIIIHLSGISLSLSLVPHDRASEVSVRVLFLIWYFCCQSASWSLASETLKRIQKRNMRAKTSEFVKEKKEYRLVLYTVRNSRSQKQHVCVPQQTFPAQNNPCKVVVFYWPL